MKPVSHKPATSKYLGVRWVDAAGKWKVEIQVNGKKKHVAMCATEDEAARRYNRAAMLYLGDRAQLNIIDADEVVDGGKDADSYKLNPPNNRN